MEKLKQTIRENWDKEGKKSKERFKVSMQKLLARHYQYNQKYNGENKNES